MSQYNMTVVITGWVKVKASPPDEQKVEDGTVFQTDVIAEPKLVLNGTEITTADDVSDVRFGNDGARAAILALLEQAYDRVSMGKQPAEVAPTQPGASA
jgi:hypothetical protein